MPRTSNNRNGFALLLVLMLIVTSAVAGVSYLYGASVKTASITNLMQASRARYLAESGLHHGLYILQHNPGTLGSQAAPIGPYYADDTGDSYALYIQSGGSFGRYRIVGIGTVGNISQTVSMTVQVTSEYAPKVQALNPKYWWRMGDTGLTAEDEMDRNDGTYVNGVMRGAGGAILGDANTAADFDGFDDHVNLGEMPKIPDDKLTIACWARIDAWTISWPRLIARARDVYLSDTYFLLGAHSNKQLRFIIRTGGEGRELVCGSGMVEIGEWFFAVATYNSATGWMRVYKDGELVGTKNTGGNIQDDDHRNARIGDTPMGPGRRWNGPIDEMFILDKALTPEQIEELYAARIPKVEVVSWDD